MSVSKLTMKIGFGPQVSGGAIVLGKVGDSADSYKITADFAGKILIILSPVSTEFLEKAGFVGVAGVVVPSIHFRDYQRFFADKEFTLLVMSKFGNLEITEELGKKLGKLMGEKVTIDGEEKTLTIG